MSESSHSIYKRFSLDGKVCLITGGAGFLGVQHAQAILEAGGIPVLLDIDKVKVEEAVSELKNTYKKDVLGYDVDITDRETLESVKEDIISQGKKVDVLINNAAKNPKVESASKENWSRLENFPESVWHEDLAVGLTGAFLASQVFGSLMAEQGGGVILNISSDLGLIAPDQRIYRKEGVEEYKQMVKPVTYSVVKHGLIGLTRYLATYWAEKGVRVNAICPSGVYNEQGEDFVKKFTNLVPMGRMAKKDEYKAAIVFLISDASSYMTGSVLVIDGGRTSW